MIAPPLDKLVVKQMEGIYPLCLGEGEGKDMEPKQPIQG
jgi:hypothetical protein